MKPKNNHTNCNTKSSNIYDDDNIPSIDLPQHKSSTESDYTVEPLPESSRPRKDGPGGD